MLVNLFNIEMPQPNEVNEALNKKFISKEKFAEDIEALLAGPDGDRLKAALEAFDGVDSASSGSVDAAAFEDLLEALGEGFHGDDLEEQRSAAAGEGGSSIPRGGFVSWYNGFLNDAGEDSECDEDIAEAREEASEAFDTTDESGDGWLTSDRFADLFEALGTTYCEEDHLRQLRRVEQDGRLSKSAFVAPILRATPKPWSISSAPTPMTCKPTINSFLPAVTIFMAVRGLSDGSIGIGPYQRLTKVDVQTLTLLSPYFSTACFSVNPTVPMGGWLKTTVGTSS